MKEVISLYQTLMKRADSGTDLNENRTGIDSVALFGHQMHFNLANGFPLVTTRQIYLNGIWTELKWMLAGETNVKFLQRQGVSFWDQWADKNGDLGPVYGAMWRRWRGAVGDEIVEVDQIKNLVLGLKTNPKSRRHLVSAWNPVLLPDETGKSFDENVADGKQALPPCHFAFQLSARKLTSADLPRWIQYNETRIRALEDELILIKDKILNIVDNTNLDNDAKTAKIASFFTRRDRVIELRDSISEVHVETEGRDKGKETRKVSAKVAESMPEYGLSLKLEMRSNDIPLGLPTNIAEYAALLQLLAKECGMMPEVYIHDTGDTHIYKNQFEQIREQITREPRPLPILEIDFDFEHDPANLDPDKFFYNYLDKINFTVYGYNPHPPIKFDKAAL